MKKLAFILLLSTLSSCVAIVFEEPQPKDNANIKGFPDEMIGDYSFILVSDEKVVSIGKNYIELDDKREYFSDSMMVRQFGNKYIVNTQNRDREDIKGKWDIFVLENKGCGMIKAKTFVLNDEQEMPAVSETYHAHEVGEDANKALIINPSQEEFIKMMDDDQVTMGLILERLE
ncbi:MAG: hypothetical protein OEX02_00230 [Cyclobacteriaceae bacterium]|nr:hypothetical protein [Cyclobacteriaceae bacterium]